ncbi:MAG: AAA family ATPase [Deltaproteobacteria bacterium]|nr:AAA family ATPase [Deltaproteobacteria bacterium]
MIENPNPHGIPRVIAVGGAKGGVGHSLVAVSVATFLAQLGRKVLLVDAAPRAATLGGCFGVVRDAGSVPRGCLLPSSPAGTRPSSPTSGCWR